MGIMHTVTNCRDSFFLFYFKGITERLELALCSVPIRHYKGKNEESHIENDPHPKRGSTRRLIICYSLSSVTTVDWGSFTMKCAFAKSKGTRERMSDGHLVGNNKHKQITHSAIRPSSQVSSRWAQP